MILPKKQYPLRRRSSPACDMGGRLRTACVALLRGNAAAYAIRAAGAAADESQRDEAGRFECQWQRAQLSSEIPDLVLDEQKLRNEICWFVFDC